MPEEIAILKSMYESHHWWLGHDVLYDALKAARVDLAWPKRDPDERYDFTEAFARMEDRCQRKSSS